MSVIKKPDLTDPKLRAKLAKGMGHNYYGEPAWPNDLLYVFPLTMLGTLSCIVGLAVLAPTPETLIKSLNSFLSSSEANEYIKIQQHQQQQQQQQQRWLTYLPNMTS